MKSINKIKSISLNILVSIGIAGLSSFIMLFICVNFVYAKDYYKLKNPFISPFKQKAISAYRYKTPHKLNLQAIIASSEKNFNIAIINSKPYYINSKILSVGKILDITKGSVIIESKKGKIIRLILNKFEGFQN